jgi:hypothetical protein
MGWLPNRLPAVCGLALERGASLPGPCRGVARKEARALADPVLGHARRTIRPLLRILERAGWQ